MIKIPRKIIAPLFVSMFLVGFIGIQTNWLVGLALFIILVGIPMGYLMSVYYLGTALTISGGYSGCNTALYANSQSQ